MPSAVLVRSADDRKFYLPKKMVLQSSTLKDMMDSMIKANEEVDIYLEQITDIVLEKFETYFVFHTDIVGEMEIELQKAMMKSWPYGSCGDSEHKKAIASLKKAIEFPYKSISDMTPQIEVVNSEAVDATTAIGFYYERSVEEKAERKKIQNSVKEFDSAFMKNVDMNFLVDMMLAIQFLRPIDDTILSGLEARLFSEFQIRKGGKLILLVDESHAKSFHEMNAKLEEEANASKQMEEVAKRKVEAKKQMEEAAKELKRLEDEIRQLEPEA